ncbi:putative sodium/metabolite cotransporter BASS5, chloroplastic [Ananas comosus]|uniref:Putative sodium/metabolite cotransporter BASS5, chloroplastic n=1 Tax=Ananas comosus TaxID=4615 RepID=A0A199W714_ANACO|nr:putative sodium/metabolite cotransporter BASS5, chloroplastic [Ananas comosus]
MAQCHGTLKLAALSRAARQGVPRHRGGARPPGCKTPPVTYYAPALGFLMFAVGVNSSPKDFIEAIRRPDAIAAGYVGQFSKSWGGGEKLESMVVEVKNKAEEKLAMME